MECEVEERERFLLKESPEKVVETLVAAAEKEGIVVRMFKKWVIVLKIKVLDIL